VTGRGQGRRSRGAVLIEFALVLPVFLLLLLGAIDWGWYFVLRETAVNAVREGARIGSVQNSPAAATQAAQIAVTSYLSRTRLQAHPAAVSLGTVTVAGAPVTVIQVGLVDYPAGSITGFQATRVPATITAQAVMRLEIQP
jgi:Flp pilus assembly protein TadG